MARFFSATMFLGHGIFFGGQIRVRKERRKQREIKARHWMNDEAEPKTKQNERRDSQSEHKEKECNKNDEDRTAKTTAPAKLHLFRFQGLSSRILNKCSNPLRASFQVEYFAKS